MDHNELLDLWNTDDFPACEEGMILAQAFLISYGEGVNLLGIEKPVETMQTLLTVFTTANLPQT